MDTILIQHIDKTGQLDTIRLVMSQRTIIIVIIVVLVILFGASGFYLFGRGSLVSSPAVPSSTQHVQAQVTLPPEAIGLTLQHVTYTKKSPSGPAIQITVTKLDGVKHIDCQLNYSHVVDSGTVTEGSICALDVTSGASEVSTIVPFGTCSDVCHYHTDVQNIKVVLQVTKDNGSLYEVDQTLDPVN